MTSAYIWYSIYSFSDVQNTKVSNVCKTCITDFQSLSLQCTHFSNEPSYKCSKYNGIIRLAVVPRDSDAGFFPQFMFKFVQLPGSWSYIKQDDFGIAVDQPATEINLGFKTNYFTHCAKQSIEKDSSCSVMHRLNSNYEKRIGN